MEGVCGSVGDCWKGLGIRSTLKFLWNWEAVRVQRMLKVSKVLRGDYRGPMTELLSPMVVMLEGLGFNLCVVPFLDICVLNLSWRVGSGRCQRWSELGWRCHTRVRQKETKSNHSEDES